MVSVWMGSPPKGMAIMHVVLGTLPHQLILLMTIGHTLENFGILSV